MELTAEKLSSLVRQLAGPLELFAAQWARSASDVVQEAFIALAELPSLPDNPRAWLYSVVRFKAISAARSEARRRKHETLAQSSRELVRGRIA